MTPDDQNDRRVGTPLVPQRPYLHNDIPVRDAEASRDAAASITRSQLDSIYQRSATAAAQPTEQPAPKNTPAPDTSAPAQAASVSAQVEPANPYDRTHADTVTTLQADQWSKYHSAWQEYYQKYYERYYAGQVQQTPTTQPTATNATSATPASQTLSRHEAMDDLRGRLRATLRTQASKVRQSRHFVPIVAALAVMLLFLFLQYNRVLFANVQAYVSPGNVNPANFIVDPSTTLAVGPDPKLIIPKINVDVPVAYDTTPDYDAQMAAMQNGVAYFGIPGANSKPGQVGNTVLSGHSSNDIIDKGDYKFIFARLDQIDKGDAIYVNYGGKRYTYTVTKKSVVAPTDVQALVYPTAKPILTLITCTPLGTSLNRLLITAEQVSPDPAAAAAAPAVSSNGTATTIPGNSPTFLQRIFGGGQN